MAVVAAPAYLAVHGAPRTIEEILTHDAVTYASRHSGREFTWKFPIEKG